MQRHTGRFSIYIRPFSYLLDLMIINFLANSLLIDIFNGIYYHFFISFSWIVISWNVGFYEVYRFTKSSEILEKIGKQYATFIVVNFAYIGYFLKFSDPSLIIKFVSIATGLIAFEKLFIYYFCAGLASTARNTNTGYNVLESFVYQTLLISQVFYLNFSSILC